MAIITSSLLPDEQAISQVITEPSSKTLNGIHHGLWLAITFSALLSLFQLSLPLYSMQLFDRALPGDSIPTLVTLSLLMFGLIACSIFIDLSRSLILSTLAQRVDIKLQQRAFSSAVDGSSNGLTAIRDIDIIRAFISSSLASALLDAPWSFAFIIVIFVLNSSLGWFTLGASILMLSMGVLTHLATSRSRGAALTAATVEFQILDNARRMSDLTKVLGIRPRLVRQLLSQRQETLRHSKTAIERQACIEAVSRGLRSSVQVFILALAAYLVMTTDLDTGAIVASSMLFARALAPAERLGSGFCAIQNFYFAWQRVFSISEQDAVTRVHFQLPQLLGAIVVDKLSFYKTNSDVKILSDISLEIKPGELVALVGPEGSGKSTLARILAGAVSPSSGSIRFDGSNLTDFDTEELGSQIGFVPEFTAIFTDKISTFISRGQVPDPETIVKAATLAGAHAMIQGLASGYDTELSNGDGQLSGGERQRLILARAFYGMPRLLILDNPTASLDDGGEATVLQALHEFKKAGCTVFIISRMSRLLHFADQLVMLERGKTKLIAKSSEIQSFLGPRLAASQSN